MLTIGKSIVKESRLVVARGWGRGNWGVSISCFITRQR